jgi:signal transduction histidine kinase
MLWPAPASFRTQAAIIAAASLAVVALAVFLVRNVISTTEGRLQADARQICISACQRLQVEYEDRMNLGGDAFQSLPVDAQDISLKGVSLTVLRNFSSVEGGIYLTALDRVMGYADPADPAAPAPEPQSPEMGFIRSLAGRAVEAERMISRTDRLGVGAAVPAQSGGAVIWTLRPIPVARDPLAETGRGWLAALVLSTLLGMIGIVSIWYMLHRGVADIRRGLHRLEDDFNYRFPMIPGDFGQIAMAINGMAERRMALEAELRRQDRLAALGKVVSGVAHEIRNPLNSMKLTLQLLDRRLKKGVPVAHEIQESLHEIDRLDMILGRLLAFGRPSMMNRQAQNLAPIMDQAIRMVQDAVRQKGIHLIALGLRDNPVADVDGPQIVQVLINLLLNAIDASPASGTVRIEAQHRDDAVRILVSDEGPGIPEESRPHVFDAYFTTKPDGMGLGLAVSREIVANHGGTLKFETGPAGTSFILLLPIDRSRPL